MEFFDSSGSWIRSKNSSRSGARRYRTSFQRGVRIIRMDDEDRLVSLARVPSEDIDQDIVSEASESPSGESPSGETAPKDESAPSEESAPNDEASPSEETPPSNDEE